MLEPPRLAICLLGALTLVASGCGSASTDTTTTASTSAGASAPANSGSQTVSTSTAVQHTTKAPQPKATESKPKHQETAAKAKPKHEAPKPNPVVAVPEVPLARQYPRQIQSNFIGSCTAHKESNASCECVLAKFELSKVEKGQSAAELVLTELETKRGAALPSRIQQRFQECKRA